MARFRFLLVLLVAWLILIFNLERPDFNLMGVTNIDIDSFAYVVFALIAISLLLLSDIAKRPYMIYVPAVVGYLLVKELKGGAIVGSSLPITVTEVVLILLTITLFRQVSLVVANFEQTVEDILLMPDNLKIASASEGEEQINHELFRARRFERPVSLMLIRFSDLPGLDTHFDMETSLQQRSIQFRIAKIIKSLIYKGDTMLWDDDDLIVCLPETTCEEAQQLSKKIYNQILARQIVQVQIGIAEFPHDGLIYSQLVEAAKFDLERSKLLSIGSEAVIRVLEDRDISEKSVPSTQSTQLPRAETKPESAVSFIRMARDVFNPLPNVAMTPAGVAALEADLGNPDFWVYDIPYQSATSKAFYKVAKRVLDVTIVLLSLPFVIPIMGVLALIIKFQDGGDVFFVQMRTGLGGRRFSMYKFRTMIPNAEEKLKELAAEGKAVLDANGKLAQPLKLDHDPRVTPIGRIMRKTSLDELPQLFNVLSGDMSLVGPRPTSWGLDSYTLLHTERLNIRPGITGLWQVCNRGGTNFDNWLAWDVAYLDRMCLTLDIKILLQTFVKVFKRSGAR